MTTSAAAPILLLALACALAPAAQAAKVYRCGPDGRTYSQTPCPAGQEVPVADPRSAEQQREAAQAASREKGMAQDLARERRQREREARGQVAVGIGPDRAASAAATAASGAKGPRDRTRLGKASAPEGGKPPQFRAPPSAPAAKP